MTSHKVIIDTDPGVDDAMAILYAFQEPQIELLGLTSIFGNVTIDIATRNALALVDMAKGNVPVAHGAQKPIIQPAKEVAWEVHGREGFGDVAPMTSYREPHALPADEFICQMVHEHPGDIVLCPVGPLTNIALALQHDPSIAEIVKGVTVMGGSLDEGGNVTPHAEANIWQDPHAADLVFKANWDVTMIGLDVTHKIVCTPEDFAELPKSAPTLGGFLNEAAQFYFDFHRKVDGINGCHMHDPAAVISIVHPEWFSIDETPVNVILDGEEVGKTFRSDDASQNAVKAALGVDVAAVRNYFLDTIKSAW